MVITAGLLQYTPARLHAKASAEHSDDDVIFLRMRLLRENDIYYPHMPIGMLSVTVFLFVCLFVHRIFGNGYLWHELA